MANVDSRPSNSDNSKSHFIGGMLKDGMNWTWPQIRLDMSPSEIQLGPAIKLLRNIVPRWKKNLSEISQVRAIKGMLGSGGIQFRTISNERIIFWTFRRDDALNNLEALGVKVHREVIPLKDS
jgi:hypothetical protein